MNDTNNKQPAVGRPTCGLCECEMNPENSTVMPELFICDQCARETQADEYLRRKRAAAGKSDGAAHERENAFGAAPGSAPPSLMMNEPWPLLDIMRKLVEAADILLNDYDYDSHGWEEIAGCRDRAKAILAQNDKLTHGATP